MLMIGADTDIIHPCEDLAQEIMERAGAGGVMVLILRRNQPGECIVMLPAIPAAIRAAAVVLRGLADRVDAQASELDQVPVGQA